MGTQSRLEATPLTPPEAGASGAGTDGADAHDGGAALRALLRAEPWGFDFFKAVHLLERLHEDRAAVGGFGDPGAEVVRFKAHTDPSFPASEIQALEAERVRRPGRVSRAMTAADVEAGEARSDARPLEMTVNFMGLTGPQGVLPLAYSQHVAARVRVGDRALRDFLDLFNHRLVSLFYRAWLRSHLAASFEAARDGDARDRITPRLHDLAGLGSAELEQRLAVPAQAVVFYAGLLAMQSRPAAALEQMLRDYFDVPVEVEQFVGAWYPLETGTQTSVGLSLDAAGQLGLGAVAGDEVWDPQARARLRIGPLPRARYDEFLPTGSAYPALLAIARFFANDQVDFEVQLVLERDDVPACVLGADPAEGAPPLGWCTWLKTKDMQRDPDETVFTM